MPVAVLLALELPGGAILQACLTQDTGFPDAVCDLQDLLPPFPGLVSGLSGDIFLIVDGTLAGGLVEAESTYYRVEFGREAWVLGQP